MGVEEARKFVAEMPHLDLNTAASFIDTKKCILSLCDEVERLKFLLRRALGYVTYTNCWSRYGNYDPYQLKLDIEKALAKLEE